MSLEHYANRKKVTECLRPLNDERQKLTGMKKKKQGSFLLSVWELCKGRCLEEIPGRTCPLKKGR